jgi:hypothetical protein
MSLPEVDHIKVYHDVTYAMYLRNVLDAWGYHFQSTRNSSIQVPDDESGDSAAKMIDNWEGGEKKDITPLTPHVKSKKVRILKGALLVLVDESSNGVFLS